MNIENKNKSVLVLLVISLLSIATVIYIIKPIILFSISNYKYIIIIILFFVLIITILNKQNIITSKNKKVFFKRIKKTSISINKNRRLGLLFLKNHFFNIIKNDKEFKQKRVISLTKNKKELVLDTSKIEGISKRNIDQDFINLFKEKKEIISINQDEVNKIEQRKIAQNFMDLLKNN